MQVLTAGAKLQRYVFTELGTRQFFTIATTRQYRKSSHIGVKMDFPHRITGRVIGHKQFQFVATVVASAQLSIIFTDKYLPCFVE